jgi:hypothetical protein
MTPEQAQECAELICNAYPNTAGKMPVINAYAKQLAGYSYKFTAATLLELPSQRPGEFCPSISDIQDALVQRYVKHFWLAARTLAALVYQGRYLPGNDDHLAAWLDWYREKVNQGRDPERGIVLRCLREQIPPKQLLQQLHRPLPPREGGPMPPPERRDREGRVCAAVRFRDWNGLLAAAAPGQKGG